MRYLALGAAGQQLAQRPAHLEALHTHTRSALYLTTTSQARSTASPSLYYVTSIFCIGQFIIVIDIVISNKLYYINRQVHERKSSCHKIDTLYLNTN